ncbi:apolipoprotein N-acyltransferase [Aquipuribacter sp. MA13-6]|uniref:apolipoprotein N-acyltransferase n=1 Tax=unclassified Aquipuribacter TaxID=2635084 RepID=UPI003EEA7386
MTALAAPAPEVPREVDRPMVPWTVAVPLAVVSGVVLDAAFPSVGAWGLAYVAVAAALLLGRGRGVVASYGYGVLLGLGFMVPQLQWSGIYVGALPWLALATLEALMLALVLPGFTLAWRLADRSDGRLLWTLPVTAGAVWVASEALRSRWPFDGFGWGRLAFSQADSPMVLLAALGGVPLVGFGVVALSAIGVCSALEVRRVRRGDGRRPVGRLLVAPVALALLLLPVASGAARVEGTLDPATDAPVRVAAVQGDVPQAGLDFNAQRRAVLDNHVTGTLDLAARIEAGDEEPVDLVLWPENASDIDPLLNEDAATEIARATDAVGAPVLLGAVLQGPGENVTNAMLLWDPQTGYRGRSDVGEAGEGRADNGFYAKQAIAPFGEYIPYRDFFRTFSPLVDRVTDFAPGDRAAVLEMGGAVVGPAICFEVVDDDVVRRQVLAGADLLVVPTNNATFGDTDENVQQLAMSRVRAVEHGRSVVHISNVGTSALIAPDGSTGRLTGLFTPDVLVGEVELRSGSTPATRLGPVPELALVAVALLLVLGHGVASSRRAGAGALGARPAAEDEARP